MTPLLLAAGVALAAPQPVVWPAHSGCNRDHDLQPVPAWVWLPTAGPGLTGPDPVGASQEESGPRDRWFAIDKLQHFTMSWAVTGFAFAGAELAGAEGDARLRIAAGAALVAGIGKELMDVRRGQRFSGLDLLYDALGVTLAVAILEGVR